MLPASPNVPQARSTRLPKGCWATGASGIALLLAVSGTPALAQDGDAALDPQTSEPAPIGPEADAPAASARQSADPQDGEPQDGEPQDPEPQDEESRDLLTTPLPPLDPKGTPAAPASEDEIAFEANTLSYDSNGETITATGNVV